MYALNIYSLHAVPTTEEDSLMNKKTKHHLLVALIVVVVLFLFFGGGAVTEGTMIGRTDGSKGVSERSWMWTPALVTLADGVLLAWIILKKKA